MKNEKAGALDQSKGHVLQKKTQGQDEKQNLELEAKFQSFNLSSQKKFTIFINFKFSKKLRYSIIF